LANIKNIYDILHTIKGNSNASRVLIVSATNGGDTPKPSGHLYTSVLYEVYDSGHKPIKYSWQRQLIDNVYSKILHTLFEEDFAETITNSIEDEDSIIKALYKTLNVSVVRNYRIAVTPTKFLFLVLFFNDMVENSYQEKEVVRTALNQLQILLKDGNK
jgi:hypothetical protein